MRAPALGLLLLAACRPGGDDPADASDDSPPVDTAPIDGTDPTDLPDETAHTGLTGDTSPPDDTALVVPPALTVSLVPGPTCADPTARATLGPLTPILADRADVGDWADQPFDPGRQTFFVGGGLAVFDVDGDDLLDVVLSDQPGARLYLHQPDGTFLDASDTLPEPRDRTTGITAADYDGDGDLDLAVGRYQVPDKLWRNDGGTFVDVTAAAGLDTMADGHTSAVSWADVDGDGDLDLFLGRFYRFPGATVDRAQDADLWRNQGDGTFVLDRMAIPDDAHATWTFVGSWRDLDGDDLPELYLVNDFGHIRSSLLLWNRGGTHFDIDDGALGLNVTAQGMGLAWGDLNLDGGLDAIVAGWADNRAMYLQGGAYFDRHRALGLHGDRLRDQVVGWSLQAEDLDNDGDLDLAQGFGHIFNQPTPELQPDAIYEQTATDAWTRVGQAWGFDHTGETRAVAAVDLDGDGWLDLLRQDLTGPATLQKARCGDAHWLQVRPRQSQGLNRFAVGARVDVVVDGVVHTRFVDAGSDGYMTSRPPQVHVGLGDHRFADEVRIRWPDGTVDTIQDVPADHHVTVSRDTTP